MIASILHDMEWVLPLRHEALTPVFTVFTFLGFTEFFFGALPLLYWCWNKESGSRIAILTLISGVLTLFFKDLFQDPRPPAGLAIDGLRPESYGLPGGHTLMAIVFWGGLAVETKKRWILAIAVLMITGISSSRLYLGVHDLEDVLGGAVIGFLLLTAFAFRKRCAPGCCRGLVPSAALFFFPILLILFWPHGDATGKMYLVTGFYVAWLSGRSLERKYLHFVSPTGWKRLGVAIAGIFLLALMAYAFRTVIFSLRVPRVSAPALGGLLIGIASSFVVPWILVKSRLLQRSNS